MKAATARHTGILLTIALALLALALWLRETSTPPAGMSGGGNTTIADSTRSDDANRVSDPAEARIELPGIDSNSTRIADPTAVDETETPASQPVTADTPDGGAVALPPKRAETQRWFAPVARARSYGELAAALATLPGEDSARRELLEPIARWCRTAAQEVYDTEAFQRYAPLRWHALMALRDFCVDAPDRTPLAGDWIQPLGMTVLMYFGRQTVGRLDPTQGEAAGRRALLEARQLVDQANALQWMQTQGLLTLDPALGCQRHCGPYYWAAAMLLACQDAGGCGYRSPITLGYCAANFGGGGCRPGADYATALRDRLSQADWLRVQRAMQELQQSLAVSG